jgi:hypothetical protein
MGKSETNKIAIPFMAFSSKAMREIRQRFYTARI